MKSRFLQLILFLLCCTSVSGQTSQDTTRSRVHTPTPTDSVFVWADYWQSLPGASVLEPLNVEKTSLLIASDQTHVLTSVPGFDLRRRGGVNGQSDINLRGGTHNQTAITLNGLPLYTLQTGHHANVSVLPALSMETLSVGFGSQHRLAQLGSLTGSVNATLKQEAESALTAAASYGAHDYTSGAIDAHVVTSGLRTHVFGEYTSFAGFIPNTDSRARKLGAQVIYDVDETLEAFGLVLYSDHYFGAEAFYTPTYPSQFETVVRSTMQAGVRYNGDVRVSLRGFANQVYDKFELFRDVSQAPSWYTNHNYHVSSLRGLQLEADAIVGSGNLNVGARYMNSEIESTVLGEVLETARANPFQSDVMLTHGRTDDLLSAWAHYTVQIEEVTTSFGLSLSDAFDNTNVLPEINVAYDLNQNNVLSASLAWHQRLPTYTELYYDGPTNVGNADLQPERSVNVDLGWHHSKDELTVRTHVFYRLGQDLIDWVRHNDQQEWQTQNYTELNFSGGETWARYTFQKNDAAVAIESLSGAVQIVRHSGVEQDLESYYALDYVDARAMLQLTASIAQFVFVDISSQLWHRNGDYTNFATGDLVEYGWISQTDVTIRGSFNNLQWFAVIENLFDTSIVDVANVPTIGRWLRLGMQFSTN